VDILEHGMLKSLNKTGSMKPAATEMAKYNLDLVVVQEVKTG
jgi:hypothetical protein